MGTTNEKVNLTLAAKDKTKGVLGNIKNQIIGIGLAYGGWRIAKDIIGDSIKASANYEATMKSLRSVVKVTGRDMNDVYEEMRKHVGGLASDANVAEGFLKGMTTTLNVQQISDMTRAIKDASVAMGEDFNTQLPLIIKAVKQLNPAILDNIGVTVRLDKVNKKITEGFYGAGTAINEYTQQNAIFQEIMKQTAQFQGQEAALLETSKGKYITLTTAITNAKLALGEYLTEGERGFWVMEALTNITNSITIALKDQTSWTDQLVIGWYRVTGQYKKMIEAAENTVDPMNELFDRIEKGDFQFIPDPVKTKEGFDEIITLTEEQQAKLVEGAQILSDQQLDIANEYYQGYKVTLDQIETDIDEYSTYVVGKEAETTRARIKNLNDVLVTNERVQEDTRETFRETSKLIKSFASAAEGAVYNATRRILDNWEWLREESKTVFGQMAKDFIRYFIDAVLNIMATYFALKFLGFLGGLFDTPANDRMAMTQGRHFAEYFTQGVMGHLSGFNMGQTMVGAVSLPELSYSSPTVPVSGGFTGAGNVNININIDGNIYDSSITEQIEDAVINGLSRVSLEQPMVSGDIIYG